MLVDVIVTEFGNMGGAGCHIIGSEGIKSADTSESLIIGSAH
jgi:hypothetical protein